jgi:hypothetical protein
MGEGIGENLVIVMVIVIACPARPELVEGSSVEGSLSKGVHRGKQIQGESVVPVKALINPTRSTRRVTKEGRAVPTLSSRLSRRSQRRRRKLLPGRRDLRQRLDLTGMKGIMRIREAPESSSVIPDITPMA